MNIGLFVGIFFAVFALLFIIVRIGTKFILKNINISIDEIIKEKEYARAEKIIRKKIVFEKDKKILSDLHFKLAFCLDEQSQDIRAIVEYKAALKFGYIENEETIRFRLAALLMKIGKKEEALAEYLVLLKFEKVRSEVYSNVGRIYYENGNYEAAIEYIEKAISDDKNKDAPLYLGLSYLAVNNIPKAYELLNRSMHYYSKNPMLRYYLGKVCRLNKDYTDAMMHLNACAENASYEDRSYLEIALCYVDKGEIQDAIKYLTKSISVGRDKKVLLAARYVLTDCYEQTNNYKGAMKELETIVTINSEYRNASERLMKYKQEQQSDIVKEYINSTKEEILRKASLIAGVMDIKTEEAYYTQNFNVLIIGTLIDQTNETKSLNAVYVCKSQGVFSEEEIKKIYEFVRLQKAVRLLIVTTKTVSQATALYAKQHYIDIFLDDSISNILQKTLTVSSKTSLILPKPKMLPF